MNRLLHSFLIFVVSFFILSAQSVEAQEQLEYVTGTVQEVTAEQRIPDQDRTFYIQELQVKLQSGEVVDITAGSEFQPLTEQQLLSPGRKVVVTSQLSISETGEEISQYVIADVYRLPVFVWLVVGFVALTLVVARWRGASTLLGMVASFFILTNGIIPQILAGVNPVLVSSLGATGIAIFTIYLSHGFSRKSHISIISIVSTLWAAIFLSELTVKATHLVGLAGEEAYFLQFAGAPNLNLQGLLLAGVILGALGVLDDIVVSQVSVVHQLAALTKLPMTELYFRALEVGKDHVASLVNTLVLAYVGANLPLFLLFYLDTTTPLWVTLNTQIVSEELLRTLIGSISLILSVPLTTVIAAVVYRRWPEQLTKKQKEHLAEHGHVH